MPPALLARWQEILSTADEHRFGEGIRIAMIDSGLSWEQHPGEFTDEQILAAESLVGGDGKDITGHGTAVASLICGQTLGIATSAKLHSYRCLAPGGSTARMAAVCEALRRAIASGFDLVNISLGSRTPWPTLEALCGEAAARGVIVVASAGNDASRALRVPAAYGSVLSVGAVDYRDQRLAFSSFEGNRYELDVVDFGEGVLVADKLPVLRRADGTSYATATATGLLALVAATHRRKLGEQLTLAKLQALLPDGCIRNTAGRTLESGAGRLSVIRLISQLRSLSHEPVASGRFR